MCVWGAGLLKTKHINRHTVLLLRGDREQTEALLPDRGGLC